MRRWLVIVLAAAAAVLSFYALRAQALAWCMFALAFASSVGLRATTAPLWLGRVPATLSPAHKQALRRVKDKPDAPEKIIAKRGAPAVADNGHRPRGETAA